VQPLTPQTFSRIDKLLLDDRGQSPEQSRQTRQAHGLAVVTGQDVAASYELQLALLSAINLGTRTFGAKVDVFAPEPVWSAPCLVPAGGNGSLLEAVTSLGGQRSVQPPASQRHHILIGAGVESLRSIRATFDGWLVGVGPARQMPRLQERPLCPLAPIAAAALAVCEIFADFAQLNVEAARRTVSFSLWRPDRDASDGAGVGQPIVDLPASVGVFGLGHLGQAYLWALAALRYEDREKVQFTLYDDDPVEPPNLETGVLLQSTDVGGLKTRAIAHWLEARDFTTRVIERRITESYRLSGAEPLLGLCGFDDNQSRQWLTGVGLARIFDSGLGGEAYNFDTIAFHAWPNPRPTDKLWKVESASELAERVERRRAAVNSNAGYAALGVSEECGHIELAGKSVAVPFVGALSACMVVAELLKSLNGGPVFSDITLRLVSSDAGSADAVLQSEVATPIRGVKTQGVPQTSG